MEVIDISEKKKWESTIDSFDQDCVYCSREYVNQFAKLNNSSAKLFYYKGSNCRFAYAMILNDIGDLPEFRNNIGMGQCFDMNSPYGYGGPIWQGNREEKIDAFFKELYSFAQENKVVSQFIRFNPISNNFLMFKPYVDFLKEKQTICVSLLSPEKLWAGLDSKNRNVIRKAQKIGVTVRETESIEDYVKFRDMYKETMKRLHAEKYYYFDNDFFDSMRPSTNNRYRLFVAEYDGKIICSAIVMIGAKCLHYHLSASDKNYRYIPANNLLLYEIGLWGIKNGYTQFHLGGGVKSEDSLYKFKKTFSKEGIRDFYIGRNIFSKKMFDELVEIRRNENTTFDKSVPYLITYRYQLNGEKNE